MRLISAGSGVQVPAPAPSFSAASVHVTSPPRQSPRLTRRRPLRPRRVTIDENLMDPVARRVDRSIRQRELLAPGDRVVAAVSGGADSVALACLLTELAPSASCEFAG